MIENRCPSCRWRVMHEQGSGRPQVPCCHGGSPVTIHGDFPFCPEPPYDYCAAFGPKDGPTRSVESPPPMGPRGPVPEEPVRMIPMYGCPVPPDRIPPGFR